MRCIIRKYDVCDDKTSYTIKNSKFVTVDMANFTQFECYIVIIEKRDSRFAEKSATHCSSFLLFPLYSRGPWVFQITNSEGPEIRLRESNN